jgi:iron complex transport system substrate-binding protein
VQVLPKTCGLDNASIGDIARLHPDLVLVSRAQRISDRLEELNIRSFVVETQSYSAIAHTIDIVAALLGVEDRAPELKRRIELEIAAPPDHAAARKEEAPSVYFEVDAAPYAAGASSFIGEMLARLNARDIIGPALVLFLRSIPNS